MKLYQKECQGRSKKAGCGCARNDDKNERVGLFRQLKRRLMQALRGSRFGKRWFNQPEH